MQLARRFSGESRRGHLLAMTVRISVALCTYNGARFIAEQLASISAQTRRPDELVVCDDRSEDKTREILEDFASCAPFVVKLYINQRNLGSTKNFEKAITLCTGEIIALADQDDLWRADKLSMIEEHFALKPRTGLVFSDAEIVDEYLRPLGGLMWDRVGFDKRDKQLVEAGRAFDVLLPGWTVTGATMAFRSSFRELLLPVPNKLPMIHDGWMALLIAAVADVAFIEEPLIRYRQHANQQIGAPANNSIGKDQPAQTKLESARLMLRRVNTYSELINLAETVQKRLVEKSSAFDSKKALSDIARRIHHLKARANLPGNRVSRVPTVLRELITLRYYLYSNGIQSAAKDLMS